MIDLYYIASQEVSVVAMYLASVDDKAMVGCLRDFHYTREQPTRNMIPVVDKWSSCCSAQSESECPERVR